MDEIAKVFYQFYEQSKPMFILLWAWILSIITPVETILLLLCAAFIFNMLCGIVTGINIQKEEFDKKKFLNAFIEAIVISLCILFVNTMFVKLGDPSLADTATKIILYLSVYVYATKSLGNLMKLYPSWTIISLLHDVLTTAVLSKLKERIGLTTKSKIDEL